MNKRIIGFALFAFCILPVQATKQSAHQDQAHSTLLVSVNRVYDGDTLFVDIPNFPSILGEDMPIRVRGIDTPEIRGKCPEEKVIAKQARDQVRLWSENAERVELTNIERGKYFRLVATVLIDGEDIGEKLVKLGLARPYDGQGKRQGWCNID